MIKNVRKNVKNVIKRDKNKKVKNVFNISGCVCWSGFVAVTGRDRRFSGPGGQGVPAARQRATRSSRDLLHGEDMETVMADALVSCKYLYSMTPNADNVGVDSRFVYRIIANPLMCCVKLEKFSNRDKNRRRNV